MIEFLFFLFAAMATLSAIFMVTQVNPVASVLYLVVTFFSLSGLFVILDAHFIAAVQVMVYAGAIMVLFLFVIMLLNLGSTELSDLRRGLGRILAGSVAVALVAVLGRLFMTGGDVDGLGGPSVLDPLLESSGAVAAVAEPLFTRYLVAFEVTSILLVVAIVGSVVLARRRAP
ncbi:MAG: NADH-quinone oxidoreductase subunit J [Gemmatimonadales bacterium]